MKACSRCDTEGLLFTNLALCANCHQKELSRDRSAYYERIARENALLAARRDHPAGKSAKQRARHLWQDITRYERSGEAEHKEECAS